MKKLLEISSNSQNKHWLDIAEIVSVIGSVGGSVASLVSNQFLFASLPLSVCIALNLANRRRLINLLTQENQKAIATIVQQNKEEQTNLSEQLQQLKLSTHDKFARQSRDNQANFTTLSTQIAKVEQLISDLNKLTQTQSDRLKHLNHHQNHLEKAVSYLSEINSCSQALQLAPFSAELYYRRGNSHRHLGNKYRAVEDYTKAIELEPHHALAYHHRGLVNADLSNKKAAVEDLRKAAKFYFEQGDLIDYQKTKDMSLALHELNSDTTENTSSEQVLASTLFS
ncbi:tetratricopeptide repeat protein [Pleurocapsales cyanobacterium LEGE 06147]|nr:tetratricopeptide repeat protein [Pleurocapsales cyanobacterium LEGE 06147]